MCFTIFIRIKITRVLRTTCVSRQASFLACTTHVSVLFIYIRRGFDIEPIEIQIDGWITFELELLSLAFDYCDDEHTNRQTKRERGRARVRCSQPINSSQFFCVGFTFRESIPNYETLNHLSFLFKLSPFWGVPRHQK